MKRALIVPILFGALVTPWNLFQSAVCQAQCIIPTTITTGPLPLKTRSLYNDTAYITSQCYTITKEDMGEGVSPKIHNPCFSCHTDGVRPNFLPDGETQTAYSFPDDAVKNPWSNLFKDRTYAVRLISDKQIMDYARTDNYFDDEGNIKPAMKLADVPEEWDYDNNGHWDGYVPDCYFTFDNEGFDHRPGNAYTGWRAFGYYPFLGTFWPTNGSTDDVMIRLPAAFQTNNSGQFDISVYKVNLAIIEAMLKETDIDIAEVDEAAMGNVDIDKDGQIGTASQVKYDWAPNQSRFMYYVGQAKLEQDAGRVHIAAGLYPEGTEFLHTVRYIDFNEAGDNMLAPRMKEVRYAKKLVWVNYSDLQDKAFDELKERHDFPDRIKLISGNMETGVGNDQGWKLAAFIEDRTGELRPQSYEELVFCVGCHSYVGAVRDGIYSFHRKFGKTAPASGWHHWSQHGIKGVPERIRKDGKADYGFYLQTNGAGDEFRGNQEVWDKFFDESGNVIPAKLDELEADISLLLFASKERAMLLNKAYRVIVQEQSFTKGRDATVKPVVNVHRQVEQNLPTGVETPVLGY